MAPTGIPGAPQGTMKTFLIKDFLQAREGQILDECVAVGIHPSSEVDLVLVDGVLLGVGAIVPARRASTLQSVRIAPADIISADDYATVGGKLVLQLYEKCDALIPPGPRLPWSRSVRIKDAAIGVDAANATLAFRLPMWGRPAAMIFFTRLGAEDLTMVPVGARYGIAQLGLNPDSNNTQGPLLVPGPATTFVSGTLVGVNATLAGEVASTFASVGGDGDAFEYFDEIFVFVYGPAAGGDAIISAEVAGERV